jgi:RNA polymerase sigma-70 factor, ECF subfamily
MRTGEMTMSDDASLVAGLQAGDPGALEALMTRYGGRVYRVAFGITRSAADAEEVVQDVFLGVFRKIGTFEGRAALGTWIYRIAANTALIKRRGRRFEREVSLEESLPRFLEDGHREGDRTFLLADWSRLPDEELAARDARSVLARGIAALPDHYRAVLVLRDVEELSNEETAEALGESVGTVKSRLHRARMALREALTRSLA